MNSKLIMSVAMAGVLSGCSLVQTWIPHHASAESTMTAGHWESAYGGVNKSYDTRLLKMRAEVAPRFRTLTFYDNKTGRKMAYDLYIPDNYNPDKRYPLVLFMADGSTVGKGVKAPLMQGYGGIIWATRESQAQHPSFVLVPAFAGPETVANDHWQVSDEVGVVMRLLDNVVDTYSIDQNRLYTTGQSMGGMVSFYLNAHYPTRFAATIYVASQWNVKILGPLVNQSFFYIVSAADPKASAGMSALGARLKHHGRKYGLTRISAKFSQADQDSHIQNLLRQGNNINFVVFNKGTVTPRHIDNPGAEHMYSFDYAYQLKGVRDWLFRQHK